MPTKFTHWTTEEVQFLRDAYERANELKALLDLDHLAAQLGRPKTSICRKARALGLTNQARPWAALSPERQRSGGERTRAHIAEHGHPRGALGITHGPETRAVISAKVLESKAKQTPDAKHASARKAVATKLDRYGTANPSFAATANPHSRTKSGKREDLGGQFFRSGWEANYARYLNWLIDQGEIRGWEYEPDVFRFEGVARGPYTYTPDFKVTERDGRIVYHEVKGWMDGPSKSRLKRMAKHYPAVTIVLIDKAVYREIEKWREVIPHWEGKTRL